MAMSGPGGDGNKPKAPEKLTKKRSGSKNDPNARAFIPYNMGLVFTSNGDHQRLWISRTRSSISTANMPQALNHMAVIHHDLGLPG